MMDLPGKKPLILVVDDDAGTRLLAEAALQKAGYAVAVAADGGEAVAACERLRPDLVLMDVVMPGMDGFTAVHEIRRLPCGNHVPIVAMTGLEDLASIRRAYEAGFTDFATKPVNWAVLGYRVGYILASSRAFLDLARSEAKTRALVRAIPDRIFRVNGDGTVPERAAGERDAAGASPSGRQLPGVRTIGEIFPEDAVGQAIRSMETARSTGGVQRFEYSSAADGESRSFEARVVSLPDGEALFILRDITDRKRAEERLTYMAYNDALTGLPNRVMFQERLEHEIANARRRKEKVGIILFDLDRFKDVNDTLGHVAGDRILAQVAERLRNVLRETDTAARLGGDEFCVILPGQSDANGAAEVCRRIRETLSSPFLVEGRPVHVAASLGIAMYPVDGETLVELVKKADIAMFRSKGERRGSFLVFGEESGSAATDRSRMEKELRSACENGEFIVHYQPEVDLAAGRIVGAEALVRWRPHGGKPIFPMDFLPLAEETGVIVPLSEFVFRTACLQTKEWSTQGFPLVRISVNVSARLFREYDLAGAVWGILREAGAAPESLGLEVTEAAAMYNMEKALETLWKLDGLSIRSVMDDFGAGYSSLACLRKFPFRRLKIDRTLIHDLERNSEDRTIVRTIVAMAGALGIEVVAEGVERAEQEDLLKRLGCRFAQGFRFGKPMPAEEFTEFLEKSVGKGGGRRRSSRRK